METERQGVSATTAETSETTFSSTKTTQTTKSRPPPPRPTTTEYLSIESKFCLQGWSEGVINIMLNINYILHV